MTVPNLECSWNYLCDSVVQSVVGITYVTVPSSECSWNYLCDSAQFGVHEELLM